MERYTAAARTTAAIGALAGLGVGLLRWSPAWPSLSLTYAVFPAACGWLVGLVLSPVLAWALSRRPSGARSTTRSSWRRLAGAGLSVLAIAPAALWLAALVGKGPLPAVRDPKPTRPSIVFITVDALRADHLGCYGSDRDLTPHIDAFARDATRYDAAYVSSPWTLTSFATIFSQLSPSQCGLRLPEAELHAWYRESAKLLDEIPVLPEQLQAAGYTTAAELTNGFLSAERGWRRGVDHFRNEEDNSDLADIRTRADNVTRNALSWLRLNRREPFFLWVHYIDPHLPYDSPDTPDEVRERYSRGYPDTRNYWYETMEGAPDDVRKRYEEYCRAMYAEEVRYADRWVGRLLDRLRQMADFDSMLVVISTDHGEELFDHNGFEHGHSLHEEVLRVPLLIKWPAGYEADREVTQTVGLASLARTALDIAGVAAGEGEGAPALPRRSGGPGMEIHSEGLLWGADMSSLTTDDYKVIYHRFRQPERGRFEVYDRRRDRSEQHDLSDSQEALDLRDRLVEQTRASDAAAREWKGSGRLELEGAGFSEENRQRLKALGYIGG